MRDAPPIDAEGRLADLGPLDAFAAPPLSDGEVHVWFAAGGDDAALRPLLDAGEAARADRFVFPEHRARFTVSHGALRIILGAYLGRAPADLSFTAGAHGKPELAEAGGLCFSLSHSGEGVAVAVAAGIEVGIDIEWPKVMKDRDDLVVRYFSAAENRGYFALDPGRRDEAFFRLWTRKEAFLKGIGLGLSRSLDSFTVNLQVPAAIDAPDTGAWALRHLSPGGGFVGALAARHPSPVLRGGRLRAP